MNPVTSLPGITRQPARTSSSLDHADDGEFELAMGAASAAQPAPRRDAPEPARAGDDAGSSVESSRADHGDEARNASDAPHAAASPDGRVALAKASGLTAVAAARDAGVTGIGAETQAMQGLETRVIAARSAMRTLGDATARPASPVVAPAEQNATGALNGVARNVMARADGARLLPGHFAATSDAAAPTVTPRGAIMPAGAPQQTPAAQVGVGVVATAMPVRGEAATANPPAVVVAASTPNNEPSAAPGESPAAGKAGPAVVPANARDAEAGRRDASRSGQGDRNASDQRGSGVPQQAVAASEIAAAPEAVTPVTMPAGASRMTGPAPEASALVRADATLVTPAADDARFEPVRRAADQVTLQFQGEDGLEGRLRIAVRGDTVHASILSSHEGTLQRLGSDMGTLRRALNEQGFSQTKISVHDLRAGGPASTSDSRQNARGGDDRRQGEPQRRSGQGRESRQGGDPAKDRRAPRDERRSE